jgi:hypothetical protein
LWGGDEDGAAGSFVYRLNLFSGSFCCGFGCMVVGGDGDGGVVQLRWWFLHGGGGEVKFALAMVRVVLELRSWLWVMR